MLVMSLPTWLTTIILRNTGLIFRIFRKICMVKNHLAWQTKNITLKLFYNNRPNKALSRKQWSHPRVITSHSFHFISQNCWLEEWALILLKPKLGCLYLRPVSSYQTVLSHLKDWGTKSNMKAPKKRQRITLTGPKLFSKAKNKLILKKWQLLSWTWQKN